MNSDNKTSRPLRERPKPDTYGSLIVPVPGVKRDKGCPVNWRVFMIRLAIALLSLPVSVFWRMAAWKVRLETRLHNLEGA